MADERKYYVLGDHNYKYPAMTAEQVLAAIAEATGNTPTNVDDAFISKIKEMNANKQLKFWIGTMAEFNALAQKADDTLYIFTDDDTSGSLVDIASKLDELTETLNSNLETIEERLNNLGFKEGTATVNIDTTALNYYSQSLKKQGKYCLFSIALTNVNGLGVDRLEINIPEGFRPKYRTAIADQRTTPAQSIFGSAIYGYTDYIETNGDIVIESAAGFLSFSILNTGWELE